jgi:hypothetical protein
MGWVSVSDKSLISVTAVIAVLFAYGCYAYQLGHPPCCDSLSYSGMAKIYATSGIINTPFSDIRTYGYPIFLSVLWRVSEASGVTLPLLAFVVQVALYIGLSGILAKLIYDEVSPRVGVIVALGLTANLLVYPSLSIVLTDGFSVVVELSIILVLASLFFRRQRIGLLSWATHALVIGLLAGYAAIVRPASINFVGFVIPALIFISFVAPPQRGVRALLLASWAIVGFALAVTPQILFNWHFFHKATFLPSFDLPGIQLLVGQSRLKYGTLMVDGVGHGMPYASPWITLADGTTSYFFRYPRVGLLTAAIHVFGALDFDYLFTYIYDINVAYRPVLFLFSQTIVFWGISGWVMMLLAWRSERTHDLDNTMRARNFFLVVSGAYVVSWLAVYAPSAVENRFALPIITLLMPLALWAIIELLRHRQHIFFKIGGFAAYLFLAGGVSLWLSTLRVIT